MNLDRYSVEQVFLAGCYAVLGLSTAALIVLRLTARRIDAAVTLPGGAS